jgi:hypothetical protein
MVSRRIQKRSGSAFVSSCLCVYVLTGVAACSEAAAPARPAPTLSARQAERSLAKKGINLAPGGQFHPDQPVTRGELALVLVRMIDYLENQGPRKVSQSKSPPLVAPRVRAALQSLPHRHPAYGAVARLARGGYLLPSNHGEIFLPTRQTIDRPVTARELSAALAGIACRIAEKRAVLEHPKVLEDQRETVTSPGQHRGLNTGPQ